MRKISSFTLAFAFLMPLAGCPGGDDGESDTVVGTTTMTPTSTMGETMGETEAETAVETAADTTDGGGGAGFCALACSAAADCAQGGNEADWQCTDGFCEYIGTPPACDDVTCSPAIGGVCADVDGVNQCTYPCTEGGTECDLFNWECTGTDDAGNDICQPPPTPPCGGASEGEACTFGGDSQFGVCMNGECSCADDTECTASGFACNN
jgi:hypothetical protein